MEALSKSDIIKNSISIACEVFSVFRDLFMCVWKVSNFREKYPGINADEPIQEGRCRSFLGKVERSIYVEMVPGIKKYQYSEYWYVATWC